MHISVLGSRVNMSETVVLVNEDWSSGLIIMPLT